MFFPNIFSPNDDGLNDRFYPQSKQALQVLSFQIFDRWGALIYQKKDFITNQENSGWNGLHPNGDLLSKGIYVYTAYIAYPDGVNKQFVGDVVLAR